jgi:hypothetical protein
MYKSPFESEKKQQRLKGGCKDQKTKWTNKIRGIQPISRSQTVMTACVQYTPQTMDSPHALETVSVGDAEAKGREIEAIKEQ